MYKYFAVCDRVIDGDTFEATIDLGFYVNVKATIRFADIDTPEARTLNLLEKQAGLLVKDYVAQLIEGKRICIATEKVNTDGRFGRYLAKVFVNHEDEVSLNEKLLNMNLARVYSSKNGEWDVSILNEIVNSISS